MYCGATPPSVILHIDHINPVAFGGGNETDNLVTSCAGCNLGKSSVPLSTIPQTLGDRANEVKEREKQLKGYHDVLEGKRQRLRRESFVILDIIYPGAPTVPTSEFLSTKGFVEKLGFHEVQEAMEIATQAKIRGKSTFRYFCGICWNKIRKLEIGDAKQNTA
jgi:hypothetical protein